jgi:streptogramin lyase
VWVSCTLDNVLLRLDPASLTETARVTTPTAPDGLALGPDGAAYLVCQQGPTVLTVDTATATVRSTGVIGTQPQLYDKADLDVAVSTDAVWVSSFAENAVHRLPRV